MRGWVGRGMGLPALLLNLALLVPGGEAVVLIPVLQLSAMHTFASNRYDGTGARGNRRTCGVARIPGTNEEELSHSLFCVLSA